MALLAPDPRRIADPPAQAPAEDRVPDAVAAGTPEPLRADLVALLGERVLQRASDLVAYASDASPRLEATAGVLADEVLVPAGASCCGFAGARGLLHPELAAAATSDEAAELADHSFDAYVSSNRTCELGLQQATGRPYRSVVQALEEPSR